MKLQDIYNYDISKVDIPAKVCPDAPKKIIRKCNKCNKTIFRKINFDDIIIDLGYIKKNIKK